MATEESDPPSKFIDLSFACSCSFETVEGAPDYVGSGPIPHILLSPGDGGKISFGKPSHTELFNFWSGQIGDGELPKSTSFDPISVRKAMGYINVIEPINSGEDFLYRLFGTYVSESFRKKFDGKSMSVLPSDFKDNAVWQTRTVYEKRKALYSEHIAPVEVSAYLQWSRLVTPWVDDAGNVDRIISCNVPTKQRPNGH